MEAGNEASLFLLNDALGEKPYRRRLQKDFIMEERIPSSWIGVSKLQ